MATLTVTIETDEMTMLKIKRWLSWLHWNTRWGHSGTVAMDCDGDGDDGVTISGFDVGEQRDFINQLGKYWPREKLVEYIHTGETP